ALALLDTQEADAKKRAETSLNPRKRVAIQLRQQKTEKVNEYRMRRLEQLTQELEHRQAKALEKHNRQQSQNIGARTKVQKKYQCVPVVNMTTLTATLGPLQMSASEKEDILQVRATPRQYTAEEKV
ncbi:hypothetical protein FBU30_002351, partial [Linnemannia zychae]